MVVSTRKRDMRKMKENIRNIVITGLVLLTVYYGWSYFSRLFSGDSIVKAKLIQLKTHVITDKIITESEVKARTEKEFTYNTYATVDKSFIKVGQQVTKGKLLIQLQSDEADKKLKASRKKYTVSTEKLKNLENVYNTARLLYQKDLSSQESVITAKRKYERFRKDTYTSHTTEYEDAKDAISRLKITAPFSGWITDQKKFDGDLIVKNEHILTLSKLSDLYARFYVSKMYAEKLSPHMKITYFSRSNSKKPIGTGIIKLISSFVSKKGVLVEMSFKPLEKGKEHRYLNQRLRIEMGGE